MMAAKKILLLGDSRLYQPSQEVMRSQLSTARQVVADLHDTIVEFKQQYGFGRGIAAPQIGHFYRIFYLHIGNQGTAVINPVLKPIGNDLMEVWDDCMSFPGLEVRLRRHRRCVLHFKDLNWNDQTVEYQDDLSELIQHEYDHLGGILAVQKALDNRSLRINPDKLACV